jgi:hypothetical protein
MRENGSVTTQIFAVLLFLSTLTIGSSLVLSAFSRSTRHAEEYTSLRQDIDALLEEVVAALAADTTPEVNGFDDPIWGYHRRMAKNYLITIEAESDRLNPNFIRKDIFENTALSELLQPGVSAADVQQFREDHGLSLAPDAYTSLFNEDSYRQYFSGYGWANINLLDEFAAQSLALSLTGSAHDAAELRDIIEWLLMDRQLIDRAALRDALDTQYEKLFPFVNAEALMNVNFIEPFILKELIACPDYGVSSPDSRCRKLLALRESQSIDAETLLDTLGIDSDNRLCYYLGSVTWFWRVTFTGEDGNEVCTAIICRLPRDAMTPDTTAPKFTLIGRFYK